MFSSLACRFSIRTVHKWLHHVGNDHLLHSLVVWWVGGGQFWTTTLYVRSLFHCPLKRVSNRQATMKNQFVLRFTSITQKKLSVFIAWAFADFPIIAPDSWGRWEIIIFHFSSWRRTFKSLSTPPQLREIQIVEFRIAPSCEQRLKVISIFFLVLERETFRIRAFLFNARLTITFKKEYEKANCFNWIGMVGPRGNGFVRVAFPGRTWEV